ncbi:MAG: hypothetical protein HYZ29_15005 [Myxococcales bacterium]|nr:hypothetical protein [Myxococcales bacterium]
MADLVQPDLLHVATALPQGTTTTLPSAGLTSNAALPADVEHPGVSTLSLVVAPSRLYTTEEPVRIAITPSAV